MENPYASPSARLEPSFERSPSQACWRVGKDELFVSRYADLPHRCVKCNDPAQRPSKMRKFYWHHSGWYLLILVNLLFYAIVASFVRKRVDISPGLCVAHSRQRSNRIRGAWGTLFGGMALAWVAGYFQQPLLLVVFLLGGMIAPIVVAMFARIVHPVHIDERGARFKGCGPAFLESLDRPY